MNKTNIFYVALAGSIVLAGVIVGLNLFVEHPDRGAISTPCGGLLPYRGHASIELHPSVQERSTALTLGLVAWEHAAEHEIGSLVPAPIDAFDTFDRALNGAGASPVGRFLVVSADVAQTLIRGNARDGNGHARLRWNPQTCRIGFGVIVLPEGPLAENEWRAVAKHEIGHLLGLADDTDPASIMSWAETAEARHGKPRFDAQITQHDADLVKKGFER